jgi:SAM-dependent methyltransferase
MDERTETTPVEVDAKVFWNEQARKYGTDTQAVNFDPIDNEFAFRIIERFVPDGVTVCDFGCGNGRTTLDLASSRPNGRFVGCDFSENMIASSEKARAEAGITNVNFHVLDATTPSLPEGMQGRFDVVLTKRLLINVKGPAKRRVVENVHSMLKAGAIYILIECFDAPLERVNNIRDVIGLKRIRVRPFNEYLNDRAFEEIINGLFEEIERIDYSSLYYFISRIFNAGLSEGDPAYDAPINLLAARLIKAGVNPIQGYSPEVAYVLRRK